MRDAPGREVKGDSPSDFRLDVWFICEVYLKVGKGRKDKMGTSY